MSDPRMYLISLRLVDDTYYRFVMVEHMLNTPEMQNLIELAHAKGFRLDRERLDSIEDTEHFLHQLETSSRRLTAVPESAEDRAARLRAMDEARGAAYMRDPREEPPHQPEETT